MSHVRVATAAALLVGVAGLGLVATAQDGGSAAVSWLGVLVTAALTIALAPPSVRRTLLLRTPKVADLRGDLLAGLEIEAARFTAQMRPSPARLNVRIGELVRVRTRAGRTGSSENLLELFDALRGRLTLVGQPGAGKTTAAVLLFQELYARARSDADAPVPVFISLAGWTQTDSLADWLARRVAQIAQRPTRHAKRLLPLIVPILDGLDEAPDRTSALRVGRHPLERVDGVAHDGRLARRRPSAADHG